MSEQALHVRVEVLPEPRPYKPRVVAVAGALGRAPLVSDLDTMRPPRTAMLPYPPAPSVAAECVTLARKALALGGTVVLLTTSHATADAERWLRQIDAEAAP
jgi:hypothetical protein